MEFAYDWSWELDAPAEALWPLVSDTNRFNRDTGLPVVEDWRDPDEELANAHRKLRFRRLGVTVEWEETPFEWISPRRFGVVRRYTRGPVKEMRVLATLTPLDGNRTRLDYKVRARPAGPLGYIAIPIQIGMVSAFQFGQVFKRYAAEVGDTDPGPTRRRPTRDRLAEMSARLQRAGIGEDLAATLPWLVETADPITLSRLRPYALADLWQFPRDAVLRAFLIATREGLFDLRWDLLCPLCRGSREQAMTLADIRRTRHHCDTCLIDFSVDLDQSVELSFQPNARWRDVIDQAFCVAGPQVTPHIRAQLLLGPGEEQVARPLLAEGRYRLRAHGVEGGRTFETRAGGRAQNAFRLGADGWEGDVPALAPDVSLGLANERDTERLFVLERIEWADDIVTAAEVTGLGYFRDLFSSEVLDYGEFHSVGTLTILFTDLLASTHLYRTIGDSTAFSRVIEHFEVLREAIEAHEGTIVKTIGDAVMAAFHDPVQALEAVEAAARGLRERGLEDLTLKAGVHSGPCILVTLNDRLDYFGSTVNIASRLASESRGDDLVMLSDLSEEAGVAEWMTGRRTEDFQTRPRGFDQPLSLRRIHL